VGEREREADKKLWKEAVERGFYYKPFVPLQITANFFAQEPSAVDRLAAKADPAGEAAKRVREWEEAKAVEDRFRASVRYEP